MPSTITLVSTLLPFFLRGTAAGSPFEASGLSRNHARDLPVKRATDCGTWTMFCGGLPSTGGSSTRGSPAEEACNNACFYMNFINRDFVASYDSNTDNEHSRKQSGCQTQQGSVCNNMPFSQRFHDQFEQQPVGRQKYDCDEFPMAGMAQDDFSEGGLPRNSLRCIDAHHNSAGGSQFKQFVAGTGSGLEGRTCDGELPDGANFKIAFNYDGADVNKLPFCLDAPGAPIGSGDTYNQFYLSKLAGGQSGRIDFPYTPDTSNHYKMASTGKDVLQCTLKITRTSNDKYQGWVYNNAGEEMGHAEAFLRNDQEQFTIPGSGEVKDTAVVRLRAMTDGPTIKGSDNLIYYGIGEQLGVFYPFSTFGRGNDNTLRQKNPDDTVLDGAYCTLEDIRWSATSGARQNILCYFPCSAA